MIIVVGQVLELGYIGPGTRVRRRRTNPSEAGAEGKLNTEDRRYYYAREEDRVQRVYGGYI